MKIIKSIHAISKKNSPHCTISVYKLDNEIDGAVALISGREPITGFAMNNKSKEMAYVISGKGQINIDNNVTDISTGDVIIINRLEPFFWDGELKLFITCTPPWDINQYVTNIILE